MSVGILPNVNSTTTESGCKAGEKCLFPHLKVDEQTNKKAEKEHTFRAINDTSMSRKRSVRGNKNAKTKVLQLL